MNDSALSFRRWAVILAAGLSGVIVLISMLFDPAPDAEGRELIQAYAANDRAQGLHTNLIHYGFALFAPVAYAMVALVRRRGALDRQSGRFAGCAGPEHSPRAGIHRLFQCGGGAPCWT